MIKSPKLWALERHLDELRTLYATCPGDYMLKFEIEELTHKYVLLLRRERLGLRCITGGRQSTDNDTDSNGQAG